MMRISSRPVAEELAETSEPEIAINYFENLLIQDKAA
jgi:hypothetical protein